MPTECSARTLTFQASHGREIVARFDAGSLSTDGGLLLLAEPDRRLGLTTRFARCFRDYRDPDRRSRRNAPERRAPRWRL